MAPTSDAASPPSGVASARRGLWTGIDHAATMGMELLAAILLYSALGWLLDGWLGTGPWLLAVGALVGNGAGLYLIWVRSGRMEAAARDQRTGGRRGD